MAHSAVRHEPALGAKANKRARETVAPLELGEDTALHVVDDLDVRAGGGPTAWWRIGLVALGIVAAMLLLFQLMMGGAVTDMTPGTPTTAPEQLQSQ